MAKIPDTNNSFRREFKERTVAYITAAFGLVVGLAWNEAIQALIDEIFSATNAGILAKFVYAAFLTIFLVFVTIYIIRFIKKIPYKG